ncbi:MAG: (d)CMP kinase [Planctomycetota bacterium]
MIVAIDGPSGAGKSTVARLLAERLGAAFLDTGAMYRAVTRACIDRGLAFDDARGCAECARALAFGAGSDRTLRIDGAPPGPELRTEDVTGAVSEVSAHAGVRDLVVAAQRRLAAQLGDVVAEGRDMTTAVFPDAEHRIYLDATPGERARRRAEELGRAADVEAIEADIRRRDDYDMSREVAPLRRVPEQTLVQTDGLSIDDVLERLLAIVRGDG